MPSGAECYLKISWFSLFVRRSGEERGGGKWEEEGQFI